MKNQIIVAVLFCISATFVQAQNSKNCSDPIDLKTKGFLGFGKEAEKEKTIARFLEQKISDTSTYNKSFEIGKYQFVKTKTDWEIYRKNDSGKYELRTDLKFPIKVFADHPIYVSQRPNSILEVRRNTDDTYSKSLTVQFKDKEIVIQDGVMKSIPLCTTPAKASAAGNKNSPAGTGK